jgi:hypothetical protein
MSCLLYPRKQTFAVQWLTSAKGQKEAITVDHTLAQNANALLSSSYLEAQQQPPDECAANKNHAGKAR